MVCVCDGDNFLDCTGIYTCSAFKMFVVVSKKLVIIFSLFLMLVGRCGNSFWGAEHWQCFCLQVEILLCSFEAFRTFDFIFTPVVIKD